MHDYLADRPGEMARLAAALGVTAGRLSQVRSGDNCSARLALAIERETGGAVDAAKLSSDVAASRAVAA